MTRPALHVIDGATGEIHEGCAACAELKDVVAGHESTIRSQSGKIARLQRERDLDARSHPSWGKLATLHGYWRGVCNHPRSRFTADCFWMALPLWEEYGDEVCRRAIDGAGFDPFVTQRRNGTSKRHDGWDLIFDRGSPKFEEFVNRAPRDEKSTFPSLKSKPTSQVEGA